jgi:hypothetical protein
VAKVTKQSAIGEQGVALIALRVGEMGHLWHPTSGVDSGIDGEIELRDPASGQVRNFRIGVQSKATEGVWRTENDQTFLWRADPEHIEYWTGSNQPVILVCSRPKTDEAYWRNVQEWASDPARRASGLVDFDKSRDRFDQDAAGRFFVLESRDGAITEPPGPEQRPERLKTNLMPIGWDTDCAWSVESPSGVTPSEVFQLALTAGAARSDVAVRSGRLWSLTAFDDAYLHAVGAKGTPRRDPLGALADSTDHVERALLGELARRSLLAVHWRQLRWYQPERLAYFRLYEEGKKRKLRWSGGSGRTVVLPRASTTHEGLSGYRHDAARLAVRRIDTTWLVSVTPSYLFTYDGRKVSSFHAEAVKKMKAFDRAAAVSQQLRMWEWLLTRPSSMLDADEPPAPFHLGPLVEVEIAVRPPETAWKAAPDDIREIDDEADGDGEDSDDDQGSLFDADEAAA